VAGTPTDQLGLLAALHRYLEHLGVRGYRAQGMATTGRYIRDFIGWAEERGVTHPQQVTRQVIERYQRWLYHYRKKNGEPLSIAGQRCKLVPLRGYFRWLTRQAEIPANPAADMELPRKLKRLPRTVLTAAEAERVMAGVDLGSPIGLRDRAMLEVLYATGIRRHEIARLAQGDIEAERCVMLIREGKGGKDRLLPLGERALYWVSQYLERGRPQLAWNAEDNTLFLGVEGKPLSPMWLSTLIAKRVDAAEIGKRGGCHLWRHTMATLMLEGGADIRFIQAMLGHAELSTTQIYTQVAIRQLQAVHAMTHPGARRRGRDAQTVEVVPKPSLDPQSAAQALLAVLDAERQEEAAEDAAQNKEQGT
jgi:integrase/recombinase XerD